jgi:4-hydroxythreonine-4-phosphate dehydrogenase
MIANGRAPIALTLGDPNGIGPEIAVKAAAEFSREGEAKVVLFGDEHVIRFYHERHAAALPLVAHAPGAAIADHQIRYCSVEQLPPDSFKPGVVDGAAGMATVAYLRNAVKNAQDGSISAIVGCPHNETAVNAAGIPFSGYPSLLARLTQTPEDRVFMMLIGGGLRIVHATLHERLQSALDRLTPELIEAAARAGVETLQSLGIADPMIGVFGVNPHAGEGGLFGDDDERITVPAVARLREAGIRVEGPVGADVLLGRCDIDAFVAIYHDQGHIPIKLLAGMNASALSIGSGVIFSSVGHGSAFDIAGQGKADPSAVIRTVRLLSERSAGGSRETTGRAA